MNAELWMMSYELKKEAGGICQVGAGKSRLYFINL